MQVGYQSTRYAVVQINGAGIGSKKVVQVIEYEDVAITQHRQPAGTPRKIGQSEKLVVTRVRVEQFDAGSGDHRRRRRPDQDVFRVQQECASLAIRRTGIGRTAELRFLLARDFDEAAVAAAGAAARLHHAGEPVAAVSP